MSERNQLDVLPEFLEKGDRTRVWGSFIEMSEPWNDAVLTKWSGRDLPVTLNAEVPVRVSRAKQTVKVSRYDLEQVLEYGLTTCAATRLRSALAEEI